MNINQVNQFVRKVCEEVCDGVDEFNVLNQAVQAKYPSRVSFQLKVNGEETYFDVPLFYVNEENGEQPSGKATGFDPVYRGFESLLLSQGQVAEWSNAADCNPAFSPVRIRPYLPNLEDNNMLKVILAAVLLTFAGAAVAETQPYVEYKNEYKWVDGRHDVNIDHLRLGLKFDNFYIETGAATSTFGTGFSSEIGYKFKFKERWELKGKWEGVETNPLLKHKLETEIRYYFK